MPTINLLDILHSHGPWSLKIVKVVDYVFGSALAFILPAHSVTSMANPVKKVLVIRPGGIGDAVFLLPILKNLKAQGLDIHILAEPRNVEVFTSQGYDVFCYHRPNSLVQVIRTSYDVVIDTEQWHYLSAILSYFLRTPHRIGFATRSLRAKLFNRSVFYDDNAYELDNFLKLFEGLLTQPPKDINGCAYVTEDLKQWALGQIPSNSVTVLLGGSIALRRLSKEQLERIINEVISKGGCPVLLGGRDVSRLACDIVTKSRELKILNFVGQTSLAQSLALIQRSQHFLGPDSGLMHLACAVGTPVTAFFGPGNLAKWQPKGSEHRVVTENVSCSPCTRFGYTLPTCQGTYHCMKNIKFNNIGTYAKSV
jgi:ADP-heptose:LPS heptosyltransferase